MVANIFLYISACICSFKSLMLYCANKIAHAQPHECSTAQNIVVKRSELIDGSARAPVCVYTENVSSV